MKKRLLSLLLASATCTISLAPLQATAFAAEGIPFSQLPSEPFDDTEIRALITEVRESSTDPSRAEELPDLLDAIYEIQLQLQDLQTLFSLYSDIHVSDTYYSEEALRTLTACYEISDEVSLLYKELLSSPCSDTIRTYLGEEDAEYYLSYDGLAADQIALSEQEQTLLDQYAVLMIGDNWEEAGPIYIELLKIRNQIAMANGYDTYAEYAYDIAFSRDYTPDQAAELCTAVKENLLDLYARVDDDYYNADLTGLNAATSDKSADDYFSMVAPWLSSIDSSLEDSFTFMKENGLYDMDYSDDKNPIGYTVWFPYAQEPFIFNQPGGDYYDFSIVLHEFGHFHAMRMNPETADISDLDLTEVHSQGLVLLYTQFFDEIFPDDIGSAAITFEISNIMDSIISGCIYDEFQQRVYALTDPTLEAVENIYREVNEEYGLTISDTEIDNWILVSHNFDLPFYYISYAVSAFPSLELWIMALEDPQAAIDTYNELIECGWYDYFLPTLDECGLSNPFADGYVADLAERFKTIIYE